MRHLIAAVGLWLTAACGSSETSQNSTFTQVAPVAFEGATTSRGPAAAAAHGERISDVLGCTGCHGKELQGKRFYELYASNLTRDVHQYSDDQLELLLRTGQRPDARDVWGMPSEIFQHMSAPDMKALVFHLRTLRPSGAPTQPRLPFEAETKKLIAEGTFMPAAQAVQKARSRVPVDLGPPHALGRYVTMVTCAECHGSDLSGGIGTPDLVAASAYTREEFDALMSKGVPNGPRKLELMADVAKERFSRFTPAERNAVYAYLRARAERPQ